MTLNSLTLEQYFHKIINQPSTVKEQTMFERSKAYWQSVKEAWTNLYAWEHPNKIADPLDEIDLDDENPDYYIFEMYTAPWYDSESGKVEASKRSLVIGDHVDDSDPTWSSVLDKILDEMSKHYGYDLKSQVYYSVTCPINDLHPEKAGRMLNDEILQQLLLAFPEVYERDAVWGKTKNVFE